MRELHLPNFVSPQASQELTREGAGFLSGEIPAPCPGVHQLQRTVAAWRWQPCSSQKATATATCALCPSPAHPQKGRRRQEGSSPTPYFGAPTAFCAAVTTDENPGPLEELLLLPIPSSLSMNTQRHPRSRSSHSGGSRSSRATSGAGSRCSGGAGHPALLPLAFPQPPVDRPPTPASKPAQHSGSIGDPSPPRDPPLLGLI